MSTLPRAARERKVSSNTIPSVKSAHARSTTTPPKPPSTSTAPPAPKPPLAHRLLFPHLPALDPLPPILRPNTGTPELNAEIYDFIAMALRAYVLSWWNLITPRDKDLLPAIAKVLTHVVRELQSRLERADLPALLLSDFPALVTQHYKDYRQAKAKLRTSYSSDATIEQVFHMAQPHIAVSPEGLINETYLRQAVELLLQAALPEGDWKSLPERSILREILVKPVLGNVLPKLAQPWFLHTIILNILGPPQQSRSQSKQSSAHSPPLTIQSLLIIILTAIQTISTLCLTLINRGQQTIYLIKHVNSKPKPPGRGGLTRPSLDMMREILGMRERYASSALLSTLEVGVGFSGPFFDRLIPHTLNTHVFTSARVAAIVTQTKNTMFPNGFPGPPPIIPTPEEQLILREQIEVRLLDLIPSFIAPMLIGPTPSNRQHTISSTIEPFSSSACNAHLVMMFFDLILVTLFPEMGIQGCGPTVGGEGGSITPNGNGTTPQREGTESSGSAGKQTPPSP